MAAKKTTKKRAVTKRTAKKATAGKVARATETVNVPRSAKTLAEAITRRTKRSPGYWEQVQAAMSGAGAPFRATQVDSRQTAH